MGTDNGDGEKQNHLYPCCIQANTYITRYLIQIIANEFTINSPSSLKRFNCWRVYMNRENDVNNVAV